MPRNRNNSPEPPPTMTWSRATPILVVAVLFDVVRIFFEIFWFFGPALAALYCTSTVSGWVSSLWGLTAAACAAVAAKAGVVASAVTIPFGTIMAIAVGLFGWLTIGFLLMSTNARIFKTPGNALWLIASLGIAEIPLIGTIPSFTLALWRMYRKQIKAETAALRRWEKENTDAQRQERSQQALQAAQIQAAQQAQFMQQEATNDERFNQEQATNDENYEIP